MKIIETQPNSPDALLMMAELSGRLENITGSDGKSSSNLNDFCAPRSLFAVAYNETGEAIGCGALRPISEDIAEVKRLYARTPEMGIGTEILGYLEVQAQKLGYSSLWLETRLINKRAVSFSSIHLCIKPFILLISSPSSYAVGIIKPFNYHFRQFVDRRLSQKLSSRQRNPEIPYNPCPHHNCRKRIKSYIVQ